ncbi:MAG TPA: hypothetical protein VFL82_06670 [Thermomicrobiales bacterium]|nr:hypothetical protein [Thermomicrobiales bacterium]
MAQSSEASFGQPDLVDELVRFLLPPLIDILQRIDADEFTTVQFIDVLQTDPDAKAAYDEALRRWGEDEHYSKMVIHGQVIPTVLRASGLVEWAGYAHGEDDPYAVPAWWTVKRSGDR